MLERLKEYVWLIVLAGGLFTIPFISRSEFSIIPLAYLVSFLAYIYVVFLNKKEFSAREIIGISLALRLLFLFSIPNLSNDFYRFFWDGSIVLDGINPYLYVPNELHNALEMQNGWRGEFLISQMNSANYISIYPPITQLLFAFCSWVGGDSLLYNVIALRSVLIAFEIGFIILLIKFCRLFQKSLKSVLLYAFNPLVIIEISGNLHGEGVMLFFLFLAFYHLKKSINPINTILSAAFMACAILTKLFPLILAPFIIFNLHWKRSLTWAFWVAISCLILSIPFYTPELLSRYSDSLALFFNRFEFNASIYYLVNGIVSALKGYNTISLVVPILSFIVFVLVTILAFRSRALKTNLFDFMLLGFATYLFFSTTIHPWYIISLLALSVFSNFRFAILWSLTIILSYHMYANNNIEKPLMILVSYLPVYVILLIEVWGMKKSQIKPLRLEDENL